MRELAPVLGLHLPVELRQRVEDDLTDHRLDGLVILLGVIHENARNDKRQRRGRAHHCRDAGWRLALPVRADHHVEAGLGAVLLADLGELVGARVIERIDPEAIAEIRHLKDDGLFVQRVEAGAIHDVLVRAGDEGLVRADVPGQHRVPVECDRHHAAQQAGFGRLGEGCGAVGHVDQRPAPQVGHASHRLHVGRGHRRARWRTGNFGGGCGDRNLLRPSLSRQHQEGGSRSEQRTTVYVRFHLHHQSPLEGFSMSGRPKSAELARAFATSLLPQREPSEGGQRGCPLWVDIVAKVFSVWRPKIPRAVDASSARRREGPNRFIQNRSRTSVVALKSDAAAEKSEDRLFARFLGLFDFRLLQQNGSKPEVAALRLDVCFAPVSGRRV